jgi:hypothetical protein
MFGEGTTAILSNDTAEGRIKISQLSFLTILQTMTDLNVCGRNGTYRRNYIRKSVIILADTFLRQFYWHYVGLLRLKEIKGLNRNTVYGVILRIFESGDLTESLKNKKGFWWELLQITCQVNDAIAEGKYCRRLLDCKRIDIGALLHSFHAYFVLLFHLHQASAKLPFSSGSDDYCSLICETSLDILMKSNVSLIVSPNRIHGIENLFYRFKFDQLKKKLIGQESLLQIDRSSFFQDNVLVLYELSSNYCYPFEWIVRMEAILVL